MRRGWDVDEAVHDFIKVLYFLKVKYIIYNKKRKKSILIIVYFKKKFVYTL